MTFVSNDYAQIYFHLKVIVFTFSVSSVLGFRNTIAILLQVCNKLLYCKTFPISYFIGSILP